MPSDNIKNQVSLCENQVFLGSTTSQISDGSGFVQGFSRYDHNDNAGPVNITRTP